VVDALLTAISDRDKAVHSGAALALDTGSNVIYSGEVAPTVATQHLSFLRQLLFSEIETDYSIFDDFFASHRKVKDVAWGLLRQYSEETGERIYWDDEE